jgi:hypothetical protein
MDFKKFFLSFFQVVPWLKNIRFIAGTLIILIIGFTCYRAYFMKTVQQTQSATITAQPGSTVNYTTIQNTEEKKKWWMPSPWVEPYIFKESDRDGWGIRCGLRWQF